MNLSKPLRTTSFRLAALYALFFCVSAAVLLGIMYWYTVGEMHRAIERSVASRLEHLRGLYDTAGLQRLRSAIANDSTHFRYALLDPQGRLVGGDVQGPVSEQWQELAQPDELDADGDEDMVVGGRGVRLSDGWLLWVGQDMGNLHELRERLTGASAAALLLAVMLALSGGVAMGWQVTHRVDAMNRTARSIMAGDLSRRLAVRGTGDEYDQLAEQFNAMLDRIQLLMENLRQVSSDIAHDLRTPLAHLRHRLEQLRAPAQAESFQPTVEEAIGEMDGILATFEALLRIVQIESGRRRAAFAPVDISGLLSELVETYTPVAEDMGQTIVTVVAPSLQVKGDRRLLVQMFVNLIENALRHTPAGSTVTIGAAQSGPAEATVTVADNGPGIPEADREKVFRRFYRLDSSRTTPGSGLGLTLAAAVADVHGTKVELADNGPGLRITIRFTLP